MICSLSSTCRKNIFFKTERSTRYHPIIALFYKVTSPFLFLPEQPQRQLLPLLHLPPERLQ